MVPRRDDGFTGQPLPGTGGDFIDGADVEGHLRRGDPEGLRRGTDGDVEGHLFRGGPTTQGEVIRRGPGDNPHGER